MEESKVTTIIIAVEKSSQLTEEQIREYLKAPSAKIDTNSSPKGWRVQLDSPTAIALLEKGEDTLNGEKCLFAENDPYWTIYIKGITEKVDEKDLTTALSSEGRICMTSIPKDANLKPKGISFVRFNRKADALQAAEKYETLIVNEVALECTKFDVKAKEVVNEVATFRNVPEGYSEEELQQLLSEFGQITNIKLNQENNTGIVSFSTPGSVQKAVQGLNGKLLGGSDKVFMLAPAETDKKRANTYNNLYVGNVDTSVTEDEIKDVFGQYGEIESLLLPTRKIKNDKGEFIDIRKPFIYIAFRDSKAASDVIKNMDSRTFWGKNLDIDYYDPERRKGNTKAAPQPPQASQNLVHEFASAMMAMMSQFSNMAIRGRGGYSGPAPSHRGVPSYGRGTRGNTRGSTRGGPRGPRGAPRGHQNYYNVKPQYDHPPKATMGGATSMYHMMPNTNFGQPPIHASPPPMQPQVPQAPLQQPAISSHDEDDEVLSIAVEDIPSHENEIGTFLYNKIELSHGSELAGRIAGMFLDLPAEEIFQIIHDSDTYKKYIDEAVELIGNDPS